MSENAATVELMDHVRLATKRRAASPERFTWSRRTGFVRLKATRAMLSMRAEMMNFCSNVLNKLWDVSAELKGGNVFGCVDWARSIITRPKSDWRLESW